MRRFVFYDAYFLFIRPFGILFDSLFGKYGAFSGALLSIIAAVAAWIGVQRQIDEKKYNNLVAERALINSEIERVEKQFVGMLSTNRIYDRLRKIKPLISSNRSQGYAFPILSAFSETKSKYEKARLAFITNGDEDYAKIHSNLSNFNSTIFLSYLQDIVLETNTCGSECIKKSDHTAVKSELRLTFILRQMDALEETFKKNFLVISDEMQAAKDWKFRNANRIAVLQGNLPKDQQEETEFDEPQLPIEVIVNGRFYSVRGGQGDEIEEITINRKNKN